MNISDKKWEELLEHAQQFKERHEELYRRLADNEGHSVIAIGRTEADPEVYSDIFLMRPTSGVPPLRAAKRARELVVRGKNIYTVRPIVAREAQLTSVEQGVRVEFVDHLEDGSPRRITVGDDGQLSEQLRPGFYDVASKQMVNLYAKR